VTKLADGYLARVLKQTTALVLFWIRSGQADGGGAVIW
jgi:hypothetical protein